jgi:D-arabinose 1-dehydrogenase-like Zn-dependent alcohol dehydrogenase
MVIKIPKGLDLEYAAPLMCGGATVWGALTSYDLKPGDRVAIYGVGGLGHMAIQFASTLGCDVVVLSSSPHKKDEAMRLGAKEFYVTENDAPREPIKRVNHIYLCGSSRPDFSRYATFLLFFVSQTHRPQNHPPCRPRRKHLSSHRQLRAVVHPHPTARR